MSRLMYPCLLDFNPRPSYEGRLGAVPRGRAPLLISIHAPHTRGDPLILRMLLLPTHFNPRPSYEGRPEPLDSLFPVSGISIHAPHTRGDKDREWQSRLPVISIHAPHTRGDILQVVDVLLLSRISIHAPHTRGDA